jgi:hypothetical protein
MATSPTNAGGVKTLPANPTPSNPQTGTPATPTVVKASVSGSVNSATASPSGAPGTASATSRLAQVAAANAKPSGAASVLPSGQSSGARQPSTTVAAPAFTITESGDEDGYVKLLVYADFGVGKTFLTGTAAAVVQMRDVFLLNAEAGDLTLKGGGDFVTKYHFDEIDSAKVTTFKQVARVYEFLRLHCQYRDAKDYINCAKLESQFKGRQIAPDDCRLYYTVIMDSLTEVESTCIYQLLGVRENISLDTEIAGAEWAEYKRQTMMIQRMIRAFRNLPMNVLFTCSRGYVQDEQKRFNFSPMMTGKLASSVQGFMDMVGYLTLREVGEDGAVKRRLWVQPAGKFAAKNRFTTFKGSFIDDPDMRKILQLVGLLEKKSGLATTLVVPKGGDTNVTPAVTVTPEARGDEGTLDEPPTLPEGDGTPTDEELAAAQEENLAAV